MENEWLMIAVGLGIKTTVLLALAGMTAAVLRRASAAARHAVWMAAVAGVLALPVLMGTLPRVAIVPAWRASEAQAVRRNRPAAVPVSAVAPQRIAVTAAPVVAMPVDMGTVAPKGVERSWPWAEMVAGIYGVGVAVMVVPLVLAIVGRRRLMRGAVVLEGPALEGVFAEMGVGRRVAVLCGERVGMPAVVGIMRPRIVLPAVAREWPKERLRTVVLHELAHVRRGDVLTQALAVVARAVYWPQPLMWIAVRRMEIEREKACDDLVISRGIEAPAYAQALLEVATFERSKVMGYAGVGMARASTLEGRIRAVLRGGVRRAAVGRGMLVSVAAGTLGVTVGLATLSAQTTPPAVAPTAASPAAPATAPGNMAGQAGLTSEDVQKLLAAKEEVENDLAKMAASAGPLSRDAAAAMHDLQTHINDTSQKVSQAAQDLAKQMSAEDRQKTLQSAEALRASQASELQRGNPDDDQAIAALQARLMALDAELKQKQAELRAKVAIAQKQLATVPSAAETQPAGNDAGNAAQIDSQVYYIMGNVQRPGVYTITSKDLTLLQAVAAAGIHDASPADLYVKVVRNQAGKENVAFEGVLSQLMVTGGQVQPNDVLSVGPVDEDQSHAAEIGIDTEKIAELRAEGMAADDRQMQALEERIDSDQKALAQKGKTAVVTTDSKTGALLGVRIEALKKP